jgi:leader peptidase (prepilin peptidase)/N-methyltransferase
VIADIPDTLVAVWAALLGAVVGSFLNVVIARVPAGQSVVRPRSRCPRCETPIAWYDNVPIVSWIVLRGRCRVCAEAISVRYPLVEALGVAAALLAWWRHGLSPAAAVELLLIADLVALTFIDLDTWLLPHGLTWPLIAAGVVAAALGLTPAPSLASSLWGAGAGFAAFAAVSFLGERLFRRPALGFGDVFLLSGIGAFLGVKALLPVVLLASSQGAIVGLLLMALGRMPRDPEAPAAPESPTPGEAAPSAADAAAHAVPFGPFLALAAVEWLYLGGLIARTIPALGLFR